MASSVSISHILPSSLPHPFLLFLSLPSLLLHLADPDDYSSISTTLTFSNTTLSKQVEIPIINDTLLENEEQFTGNLREVSGNPVLLDLHQTVVTIIDDDSMLRDEYLSLFPFFSVYLVGFFSFFLSTFVCLPVCIICLFLSHILQFTHCH